MADGIHPVVKFESAHFIHSDTAQIEDVSPGIRRQLLGFNDQLMMVRVWFEKGAVGQVHAHHHTQVSYVESGEFDVVVGDVRKKLKAGDSFFIPSNVDHGAVCLKEGVLLDVFTPVREDFLSSE